MKIKIKENKKYANIVNFKKNQDIAIHRWFNIKEGYSKELIVSLINDLKIKNGYIVDFFDGSGTTSLSAKEMNFKYYGFEINPFLHLLSIVKLSDYKEKDIKKIISTKKRILKDYKKISKIKNIKLSILEKVFKENLKDILKIRTKIFNIKNKKVKNFFIIAMTSILDDVGYAKKDGNGLKYPKNKKPVKFITKFSEKIDLMIDDIIQSKNKNVKGSRAILADSRNISTKGLKRIKGKVSLVVFSPPYANCFDYSEVYKLELWLSGCVNNYKDLINIRNKSLSSHLNKNLSSYEEYNLLKKDLEKLNKKIIWSSKISHMLNGYFCDMEKILKNSFDILSKNGYCVIVVGNSAYGGHIIETDVLLSKIALKIGFLNAEINIARKLRASSQQAKLFKNNNSLRESVIIVKK